MKSYKLAGVTIMYSPDFTSIYTLGSDGVVGLDKISEGRGVRVTRKSGVFTEYYSPWIDFTYVESKPK